MEQEDEDEDKERDHCIPFALMTNESSFNT